MTKLKAYFEKTVSENIQRWVKRKYFQLAVLNIFLFTLILLRSAGYFDPYFPVTINAIVVLGILASIALLGLGSSFAFVASLVFWVLTLMFKAFQITPWAERTALYSFEAFAIGVIHLIFEIIVEKRRSVLK